jgi:hypothetical protein
MCTVYILSSINAHCTIQLAAPDVVFISEKGSLRRDCALYEAVLRRNVMQRSIHSRASGNSAHNFIAHHNQQSEPVTYFSSISPHPSKQKLELESSWGARRSSDCGEVEPLRPRKAIVAGLLLKVVATCMDSD